MKICRILIFLIINISILFAQEEPVVTITPEKPVRGENVTITYNPWAKEAKIKDTKEMYIVIDDFKKIYDKNIPMSLKKGRWEVTIPTADTNLVFISFYFRSPGNFDANFGKRWMILLYKSKDIPLQNSNYYKFVFYRSLHGYEPKKNILSKEEKEIEAALKEELKYYPENFLAKYELFGFRINKTTDKTILMQMLEKELPEIYKNNINSYDAIRLTSGIYYQLGDTTKFNELQKKLSNLNPKREDSKRESELSMKIRTSTNEKEKIEMMERFIKEYPMSSYLDDFYKDIFYFYSKTKDSNKILETGENWIKNEKIKISEAYNAVSWRLAKNNCYLDKALYYADKAIENIDNDILARHMDLRDSVYVNIPMPENEIFKSNQKNFKLANYLDTKGYTCFQKGLLNESERNLRKSYYMNPEKSGVASHLIKVYEKKGLIDSAYHIGEKLIENNYKEKESIEEFKKVYLLKNGSEENFENTLKEKEIIYKENEKNKILSKRINYKIPDFEIKTDDNSIFEIKKQEKKVILIHFYETIGGGFEKHISIMNKIYDKYRDRSDICFLGINKGKAKLETRQRNEKMVKEKSVKYQTAFDEGSKITNLFSKIKYNYQMGYKSEDEIYGKSMFGMLFTQVFIIDKNGKLQYEYMKIYDEKEDMIKLGYMIESLLNEK